MIHFLKRHSNALSGMLKVGILMGVLCVLNGCKADQLTADNAEATINNCWSCTMYKIVFEGINRLISDLYLMLTEKAILLLGVGLLFWLAFKTVKLVTSLYEPDMAEYIRTVAITLFKAIVVSVILLSGEDYLCFLRDLIIDPPFLIFTHLSRILLVGVLSETADLVSPQDFIATTNQGCAVFSEVASKSIQFVIYQIYVALNSGVQLGWTMVMTGKIANILIGFFFVVPIFFMMSLVFPWIYVDSMFRIGCVIVLSPFIFVAWVFPATKGWVKPAWDVLFGSMVTILIACIYIALAITVLRTFSDSSPTFTGIFNPARQTTDPRFSEQMARLGVEALSFIALILIVNRFQNAIPNIAGYFGGDSAKSQVVSLFGGIKQLVISAAMIAVGAAMSAFGVPGGDKLIKAGANRIKEQMKEDAKATTAEVMDTGSGTGTGGETSEGSMSKAVSDVANTGKKATPNATAPAADGGSKGDDKKENGSDGGDKKDSDKGADGTKEGGADKTNEQESVSGGDGGVK